MNLYMNCRKHLYKWKSKYWSNYFHTLYMSLHMILYNYFRKLPNILCNID